MIIFISVLLGLYSASVLFIFVLSVKDAAQRFKDGELYLERRQLAVMAGGIIVGSLIWPAHIRGKR